MLSATLFLGINLETKSLSSWCSHSVCNGMPTATTLPLGQVTKPFDSGMSRVVIVSESSLATGVWFCHWQCHLTVVIWHLEMKTAQSWCGTSQQAAVSHLWWVTPPVYGHSLSGSLSTNHSFNRFTTIPLLLFTNTTWNQLWRFTCSFWFCWLHCQTMGRHF